MTGSTTRKEVLFGLIVEDDYDTANLYARMLESIGYVYDIAHTRQDAHIALTTVIPDVILLDLHLDDGYGRDILETLKTDDDFKDTYIIVASARSTLIAELPEGADQAFVKPVSLIELRDVIQKLPRPTLT